MDAIVKAALKNDEILASIAEEALTTELETVYARPIGDGSFWVETEFDPIELDTNPS